MNPQMYYFSSCQKLQMLMQDAKRRRIQVRLAQRAYRSRKEAELQALKTRVHELEMLVERINETFLAFTDDLMKSDVLLPYPEIARRLHQTIAQSLSLTNQAVLVAEDDAGNPNPETNAGAVEATEQHAAIANGPYDDPCVPLPERAVTPWQADGSLYDPQITQRSILTPTDIPMPTQGTPLYSTLPFLSTLSSSMSSLAGTTFAHRLYRACIEQGYQCLTNPSNQLEELMDRFKLPLMVSTLYKIREHFEELLRCGHCSTTLELNIPFISIGGAGTHFQHSQRSYVAEHGLFPAMAIPVATGRVESDMQGDWFDCYDVEGYLEECRTFALGTSQRFGDQKIIDETMLIDSLKVSCVCLGRAPGFPRAIVESLASAYAKHHSSELEVYI